MKLYMENSKYIAVIPIPPTLNAKFVDKGFRVSKEFQDFKDLLPKMFEMFKRQLKPPIPKKYQGKKFVRNVVMTHTYYCLNNLRDIDSMEKIINDTLQGIFYENDRQCGEVHKYMWEVDPQNPRVEVVCYERTYEKEDQGQ